ncbi:MAG TPA: LytTR family transcriptional regulator [Candidatus Luteimonas excrementigallinarum]|nr:LytTR family transcriptional regulator [Candidatus Luteimonas excrementigallinarum]
MSQAPHPPAAASPAERFREFWNSHLSWRRPLEAVIWILVFGLSAAANAVVTLIDAERNAVAMETWHAVVWEGSSALVALLLVPPLLWLCERWPLHADTWLRRLPAYVAASMAWSLIHVGGMVAVRRLVYAAMGDAYGFDWRVGLPYEYLKDVQTFALIVFMVHGYSWLWRRVQGEARMLDPPDSGIPAPQHGRETPERFLVRTLGREFLIAADDIEWLQASGNYVNLHVAGRAYPLRSTLAGIEEQLDPEQFVRIHRSYLVRLGQVESIEPLDTGDARVHMRGGTVLPCSRSQREAIRARFTAAAGTGRKLLD